MGISHFLQTSKIQNYGTGTKSEMGNKHDYMLSDTFYIPLHQSVLYTCFRMAWGLGIFLLEMIH